MKTETEIVLCDECKHDRNLHDFCHKGECRKKDCKCSEFKDENRN